MSLSEKKLNTKSILLITIILPVIVIILSSIAIVITARQVQPQDTVDPSFFNEVKYTVSAEPKKAEDALTLMSKLFSAAVKSGTMKYEKTNDTAIPSITCKNEKLQKILSFAAGSLSEKFTSFYENTAIKYGEDASAILSILPGSTPSDFTAEINDQDVLMLTLTYDSVFNNMYFLTDDTTAVKMFTTENSGVFSVINEKFIPVTCEYSLSADAVSGELLSFTVKRIYNYSANMAFRNSLSDIEASDLAMTLEFTESYSFSYAGIEIVQDVITMGLSDYDTLTVIPHVEEGLSEDEYSLEFSTYDKYLSVDENGQITPKMLYGNPITVRVTLHYLGKEFSDTCTVYVVNPVESVRISKTSLTLAKNDTCTLTAEAGPSDATIKTIIWHSSDESVIKTDENGNLTAKGAGTATISAISAQGLIVAKCEVTVTE